RIRHRVYRLLRMSPPYIPWGIDDWCGDPLLEKARELSKRLNPKCVLIEYVFLSRLLEAFGPEVYKVIDTHDVFANRHRMLQRQGGKPEWFSTTLSEENRGLRRAHCVIAIQEGERRFFANHYRVNAITVGHGVPLAEVNPPTTDIPTVIFIGSGNGIN